MKISKEFKIGIVFIVAVGLLIWGINLLKGFNVFDKQRYLYAVYNRVDGLQRDNQVLVNGLSIGKINNLKLNPDNATIMAELMIHNDLPIPANSIARIYSTDLLGSKAIEIKLGDSPRTAQSGDTLTSEIEQNLLDQVNEQMEPLKKKAISLINSVDSVIAVVQSIFNEDTRNNLSATIQNIRNTLQNVENASGNIDTILMNEKYRINRILINVESITENLKDNNDHINAVMSNFAALSDSLAQSELPQTLRDARNAIARIDEITQRLGKGEGTVGQLLTNDSLYIELENTTSTLNKLLEDIRQNPKRYVKFSLF
ncbi:MAG TPA: MlaD family protein [Bacteroidales bacterium]|nr:MlaD family protein [Bacteroidales bacterium]